MILTDINRKKLENDIHYVIQWQLPHNFFSERPYFNFSGYVDRWLNVVQKR
jgi:hypothetical protein